MQHYLLIKTKCWCIIKLLIEFKSVMNNVTNVGDIHAHNEKATSCVDFQNKNSTSTQEDAASLVLDSTNRTLQIIL